MNLKPVTIEQWVAYIQTLHYREIDLSLERVAEVYARLYPNGVNFKVISIAGTNGKGSTAELLASIYFAAGYRTGKYSSPHLQRFNERYCVDRKPVADNSLLDAFVRVEQARQNSRLTFFEFGTLLAIDIFCQQKVDIAILEVGLGGRLDAVNILDADISIITSISIDHTHWLGDTLEQIGAEKIGIARTSRPCVVGLADPPKSMSDYCAEHTVPTYLIERDFSYQLSDELVKTKAASWSWQSQNQYLANLPLPFGQQGVQLNNASLAIMAVQLLQNDLPVEDDQLSIGLKNAQLLARCQIVSEEPIVIVDVAHNQASVERLSNFVGELHISGRLVGLCGMLKDKQIAQSLRMIVDTIDEWHFVTINNERGATAQNLQTILHRDVLNETNHLASFCHDTVEAAYNSVVDELRPDDALIVFGSFFIAGDIIAEFSIA